jgi:hypothetical protein
MNAATPGDDLFIPPLNSKLMMIDFSRAARMTDASDLTTVFKAFPIAADTDHLGYVEVELIPGERWPGAYGRRFVFPVLMFTQGKCLDFRRVVEALKRSLHRRDLQLIEFIDLGMADRAYIHYLGERIRATYGALCLQYPATHHEECLRYKDVWLAWEHNDALASTLTQLSPSEYTPLLTLELESKLADMLPSSATVSLIRNAQCNLTREVSEKLRCAGMEYRRYLNRHRVPNESVEARLLQQSFNALELATSLRPMTHPYFYKEFDDFDNLMDRLVPDFEAMRAARYQQRIASHSRWKRMLHHLHIQRIEE